MKTHVNKRENEFDEYAKTYQAMHIKSVGFAGEKLTYFAEYKIRDVRKIADQHKLCGPLRILDFGAGTGVSVPYWRQFFAESNVVAADVSQDSLEELRIKYDHPDTLLLQQDRVPLPDQSIDIVFAACVFHHIEETLHNSVLLELFRVLKVGGVCVIFEHNPLNPLTLYAVNRCEFDVNAKLISAADLTQRMNTAGFSRCESRFRVFFPGFLSCLRRFESYFSRVPLGGQYFTYGRKDDQRTISDKST